MMSSARKLLLLGSSIANIKNGLLYNWHAINDARNICSINWHITTDAEWTALITYLGGYLIAGGKLKEIGNTYWDSNVGATNEFAFNARGSGYRNQTGVFTGLLQFSYFWSSSSYNTTLAYNRYLSAGNATIQGTGSGIEKIRGCSIRAVRSATTEELLLTDGAISATYVGNDGKTYRCVKIGTKIYTADHLAEMKYRNGDWIHGFDGGSYTPISNSAWAALTTEGCCAYNDNLLLV